MRHPSELLVRNRDWVARWLERDPEFFRRLVKQQTPDYFWIGCSDSRVPATEIVDVQPGEIFVHRNVANQVIQTDLNCMAALYYAVNVLKVQHIVVCGHYGCGGVQAASEPGGFGPVDNWLRPLVAVLDRHRDRIRTISGATGRARHMCEINVVEQVTNICCSTVVERAWSAAQSVTVHGWIYDIEDGLLRDLEVSRDG